MSKSVVRRGPSLRICVYQKFWVDQSQPLSRWIRILGWVVRVESLIPAEAECCLGEDDA